MKREEPLFDRNYWAGAMSVFLDDLILDGRAPVGAASPEWWRAYLAAEAQAIDRTLTKEDLEFILAEPGA